MSDVFDDLINWQRESGIAALSESSNSWGAARSYLMASNTANPSTAATAIQIVAAVATKRPVSK